MKPSSRVTWMNVGVFVPIFLMAPFLKHSFIDPIVLFCLPLIINTVCLFLIFVMGGFRKDGLGSRYRYPFFIAALLSGFIGFPFLCTSSFFINPSVMFHGR